MPSPGSRGPAAGSAFSRRAGGSGVVARRTTPGGGVPPSGPSGGRSGPLGAPPPAGRAVPVPGRRSRGAAAHPRDGSRTPGAPAPPAGRVEPVPLLTRTGSGAVDGSGVDPGSGVRAPGDPGPRAAVAATRCPLPSPATASSGVVLLLEAPLDDLQGQEVLALLAQDPAQTLDVVVVELAVSRRRPLGVDEALALEEPDLRDGHVGELLAQQGEHVPDRQVRPTAHGRASPAAVVTGLIRRPPPGTRA